MSSGYGKQVLKKKLCDIGDGDKPDGFDPSACQTYRDIDQFLAEPDEEMFFDAIKAYVVTCVVSCRVAKEGSQKLQDKWTDLPDDDPTVEELEGDDVCSVRTDTTSHEHNVRRFLQQSPLLALSSKFLSPSCAPDLGDIATYFFFEKIFRSDTRICVTMTSFWGAMTSHNDVIVTHIMVSDRNIFFKKKYVAISPRSGAHVGERNLLLSAIRRS